MIEYKNYVIEQNPNKNIITIMMPQTMYSVDSTAHTVSYTRKRELTNDELCMLVKIVAGMFE